jgi:hypothetical protein
MSIKVTQKGHILGVIEENPTTNKMDFIAENLICLESLLRLHPYDQLEVDGKYICYTYFRKQYLDNFGGIFIRKTSSHSQ